MGIESLIEKASTYMKESDIAKIREAYEFAAEAHKGQVRKSGEPYIEHPVAVAEILVNMQMDVTSAMAALLHDVVEDTNVTLDDLRERFGETLCDAGRRPDEAGAHPVPLEGRAAERELPQNVRRDGAGHPRHPDQAGGPAAQHAHPQVPVGGKPAPDRPRDAGDLLSDRPSPRDVGHQMGDGGHRPPLS